MFRFGSATATRTAKIQAEQLCVLTVSGMSCGACAARVEATAKSVDGVQSADVNYRTGTAEIVYDPVKTAPDVIARVIAEKTRFTVGVPGRPENK